MSFELAVNTSQTRAQLLLLSKGRVISESTWEKSGSHSEIITGELESQLRKQNLDLTNLSKLHCVTGPGSFTGVRVAVNFCKALAYDKEISVNAINTLDLYASLPSQTNKNIVSMIDAQKNCVFFSSYQSKDGKLLALQSNLVVEVDNLKTMIKEESLICGDAQNRYREIEKIAVDKNCNIEPKFSNADLKFYFTHKYFDENLFNWKNLSPLYIKASAPEEKINPTKIH